MGLLDDIAGQVLGGGGAQGKLISIVMEVIGGGKLGGLTGLVQQFAGKGLGDVVNSWVGTGANLPITPKQVEQGLGSTVISQIAQKSGLPVGDVTSQLSKLLPQVVDKLTPNGKIPQGDIMAQGMDLLKGLMK
jgi:uncharacterized protein YidB (DUF937 family)